MPKRIMTTAGKIAVMQAYVDGKPIQIRATRKNKSDWIDSYGEPHWDWDFFAYRVKPEEDKEPSLVQKKTIIGEVIESIKQKHCYHCDCLEEGNCHLCEVYCIIGELENDFIAKGE